MIRRPTVMVLGAAASLPYNFPLGYVLLKWLLERNSALDSGGDQPRFCAPLRDAAGHLQLDPYEMQQFCVELGQASVRSIDEFLTVRPDHAQMGKLAIAAALIPREDPNAFAMPDVNQSGWYSQHLLPELLGSKPEDFARNQLTIVSLNYDRSLEAFLFLALQSRYNLPPRDAFDLLRTLTIIHPHGLLGEFSLDDEKGRAYRPQFNNETLVRARDGIRTISEPLSDDVLYEEARVRIAAAERVMFLGFAYHPQVMDRLGARYLQGKLVEGTTYGMTAREVKDLFEDYGITIEHREDWDIGKRLRHSRRLSR